MIADEQVIIVKKKGGHGGHHGGAWKVAYADFVTALMSLFVEHAILFESFLLTPSEQQFTAEVVIPAFEAAAALHERRPLICRLDPAITEGHEFWLQYPDDLLPPVAARLSTVDLQNSSLTPSGG